MVNAKCEHVSPSQRFLFYYAIEERILLIFYRHIACAHFGAALCLFSITEDLTTRFFGMGNKIYAAAPMVFYCNESSARFFIFPEGYQSRSSHPDNDSPLSLYHLGISYTLMDDNPYPYNDFSFLCKQISRNIASVESYHF
jgi:hypothetical protein